MPRRKKQNQQQQQQPPPALPPPPPEQQQQPLLPKPEEAGDEEDGSSIGPPSLLGPHPWASGKPGDPKSAPFWSPPTGPASVEWINKLLCVHAMGYYTAMRTNELLLQATWMNLTNMMLGDRSQTQKNADSLQRGPPGSRGLMIPPLLSLPPPPRGRGPAWGGSGPRSGPYGRGWWGSNAEPPFPGPGHGGPPRGGLHKEQRHPRRLKSWSLARNTGPPTDEPQIMEDKSDRPVCRHFAKKGHCRYEDLCAFYHPGVNGPPL
ncbi:proline-rich protein 3 [Saccopteryx bilineata]|uniref:proline-rich protein 3 n=1 Tax=Saccopteryx bilineata TaxID=59482 RepID=UPI00338FB7A1